VRRVQADVQSPAIVAALLAKEPGITLRALVDDGRLWEAAGKASWSFVGWSPTETKNHAGGRRPSNRLCGLTLGSGARRRGNTRCDDCGAFGRRLGPGAQCPHCDEPVAISDLLSDLRSITIAGRR